MQVCYTDYLPSEFGAAAARLYTDALQDKLVPILGNKNRAERVLIQHLAPENGLTAFYNQKLVGILGIQTWEKVFWNPTLKTLTEEYGIVGGCFRLGGLYLLHHETEPDEWYVDGVAVAEEMRGMGIGSGLLCRLEEIASEKGIRRISLEVTDMNQRAESLYKRLGFAEIGRQNLWPFNLIFKFPFQASVQMVKMI
ncbi:MAG: hypothetical protein B6245_04905 [Desulfobacteraceae bacterium 4572_88]|nr:MAG: hypothetical protein B6245_04905 [Desulfobacteraceae bacterium 4572_88]